MNDIICDNNVSKYVFFIVFAYLNMCYFSNANLSIKKKNNPHITQARRNPAAAMSDTDISESCCAPEKSLYTSS